MTHAALGVVVAWVGGLGIVAGLWPGRVPLPALAWLALAGLLGPCATGIALLLAGCAGIGAATSVPLIATLSLAAGLAGIWRRRRVLPRATPLPLALVLLITATVGWSAWLASRTHLGWDGTVVWYHKARILAASDGRMPSTTLADETRTWMAPDYPLQVPLAMAWVRLWQPVEDERGMKVLPAAWCAALLLLVTAAVLDRSQSRRRAACALLLIATTPRLLIGEGSYTSGYADGPLAGLLAALVWLVWRDSDQESRQWIPLIALVAAAAAWTKQEGMVGAMAAGMMCAMQRRSVQPLVIAVPAVLLVGVWETWVAVHGATTGMAYAWPGAGQALARLPLVAGAYAETWADVRTWGVLWPGLAVVLFVERRRLPPGPTAIVGAMAAAGALAFLASGWPDVRAHLSVTVPRLLVGVAPAIVLLALGHRDRAVAA